MDDDNRRIDRDEMQEQIDDPENAIPKAKKEPKMHQTFKQQSDRWTLLRDSWLDAVKKIFPTMKNSLSQD
jgi:hypothetical protein